MTQQQYIERNLKGFEGDSFIKKRIEYLCDKFNIDTVIETGTYLGGTTKVLSEMFRWVFTLELNHEYFKKSGEYLKGIENISRLNLDSGVYLTELLSQMKPDLQEGETLLFFLDAHWEKSCPLLSELKAIADNGIKPAIVIHDWKVPNRPELGFDSYNGQDFTFDWIQHHIDAIYGLDKYAYHYNDKAEGAMRGVIYIYPCD